MTFETGAYFASRNIPTFYPRVEVGCLSYEPNVALPRSTQEQAELTVLLYLGPLCPARQILFNYSTSSEHYHVPLLLSPHSYTTYRGS